MKTKIRIKKSLPLLTGFWLLLLTFPLFGQQQPKITGKITDVNYTPVIGATISIKGTSTGIVSNEKGEFELKIPQSLPVTLVVSFVGYKTQEYDVYEIEPLSIVLEDELNKVKAVVVIGYGTQKRSDI